MVKKQRQFVAQFLIEQAPTLPYDCATEMELETIPDRPDVPGKEVQELFPCWERGLQSGAEGNEVNYDPLGSGSADSREQQVKERGDQQPHA